MASIDILHPLVAPEVLGCPSITIDSAILRAAIEFCEKSTAWRVLLDPIPVIDGTAEYALPLPADSRLVVIREREVRLNGMVLEAVKNPAEMSASRPGTPSHYGPAAQPRRADPLSVSRWHRAGNADCVCCAGSKTHRYDPAGHPC